jgi:hypothetical protein
MGQKGGALDTLRLMGIKGGAIMNERCLIDEGAYQIAEINCKAWASRPNIVTLAETAARSIEPR